LVGKPLGKRQLEKEKMRWKVTVKTIHDEVGLEIGGTG
jgi:hypothetical protein